MSKLQGPLFITYQIRTADYFKSPFTCEELENDTDKFLSCSDEPMFVPVTKDGKFATATHTHQEVMDSNVLEIHLTFKRNGKQFFIVICDL